MKKVGLQRFAIREVNSIIFHGLANMVETIMAGERSEATAVSGTDRKTE
jgi:hypothetical protein